ncbi:MAG: DUF1848 domain-containing protein [Alphaproteobacteria bacterium]|nr:DUF1848 domain-containing protein [Alphaproteobacteria bacterium]
MIVSASYRTDIPAFYGDWFARRWTAGSCQVRSPYGGPPSTVALGPEVVRGLVFWTRNARPFFPVLAGLADQAVPFVVQYTLTGYSRALDRSVPARDHGIAAIRELARRYGPDAVVWRYDPIVLTTVTPRQWHRETVTILAAALAGSVNEVVVSFVEPYRKTARHLATLARTDGIVWRDPVPDEKRAMLEEMAGDVAAHGMRLTLCTQPLLVTEHLPAARCIDSQRLSLVAGRAIEAREKGNRPGCRCAESRDIGRYDTCPHGCVYCYAVDSRNRAVQYQHDHDPRQAAL